MKIAGVLQDFDNYLLSRFLWDVNETKRIEALFNDFLEKCFGSAKQPMEKFHRLIYRIDSNEIRSFFSQDLIGRMYRCLGQAPGMTDDPAIKRRIYDMILYTGYSERYLRYTQAKADEKQKYFEDLIKHIYRMRHTRMIDLVAAYLTLQDTAKDVTIPGSARWNVPEGKNPWKVKDPFSDEEILTMLKKGIEVNCLYVVPYLAPSAEKLLLPEEIVKKDFLK
ncbi:MAG: hypothetical protein NC937_00025 [Candidatus Omnitrophica bacterium]|nr:hypothetical protein [Candidatus Omnitrophota bacterium]MCM8824528.1 hypothetical protein [Candidatus Omnitrophota bacterium]